LFNSAIASESFLTSSLLSSLAFFHPSELINVNVEDIMCNNYVLTNEREDSLKEAREFATVLNACGRMGHSSIGIGACLGDEEMKKKAIECLEDYRKEIVKAME
jgi:sugar-specific transcriptional regulator TrmB